MLNATSPVGKEPEAARGVDWYELDIVGLTFTHFTGSGEGLDFSNIKYE